MTPISSAINWDISFQSGVSYLIGNDWIDQMKQAKKAYKKKKLNQDRNLNCLGCSLLARQRKQGILEHLGNWAFFWILHALSFHTENHQIDISAAYANIETLVNFGLLVNTVQ